MEIFKNDSGQTLLHLNKEEWEDYGRRAGYLSEMTKEAKAENAEETDVEEADVEEAVEDETEEFAKPESKKETKKAAQNVIGSPILITEDNAFNESNFPNLIAEQQKEGLIGPFVPRP